MITAIVLTHNDEKSVGRTLESLTWCDETIVVDDYSSDDTLAIVKKYKSKTVQHHLDGDFAVQRNYGLSMAKGPARNASQREAGGDWVLFVDSDEVVTDALRGEIRQATKRSDVSGYFLKRRDFLFGRNLTHGETGNVRLLRLARKSSGKWVRTVHEVWDIKGKTEELVSPLLHFPHPDVAQFLEDINMYSSLNAQYFYKQKVHVSAWHIVAYPVAKFFVNYIWRLGFLDGTAGAVLAIMMSFHSFLTRAKLYGLWHKKYTGS